MNQKISNLVFNLKKYSPEILIGVGIAGTIVSTVLACRATLKVKDVFQEHKDTVDEIHEGYDNALNPNRNAEKKELTMAYTRTGLKLVKLYSPAVIVGTLSLTAVLTSNNVLRKRNVALAAAYAAVDKSYKEYRERVVDRYGEDVDRELRYGLRKEKVEEKVYDEETGKQKKVKKQIDVITPECGSDFARIFGPYTLTSEGDVIPNTLWQKCMDYNFTFLKAQEQYFNDLLKAKGFLFLNEVYKALGFPETKAGQIVGWRYSHNNPDGDNFVDIGNWEQLVYDEDHNPVILLDFNVDGNIWEHMI